MNIIFEDVIQPYVPDPQAKPNWDEIEAYGAPGEEIFLRAKTIHTLNQQDWANFTPAAKEYLAKFGDHMKPEEKTYFQQQIDAHP